MKTLILTLTSLLLFAASLPALPEVVVTPDMLERPLGEWQLNGVTLLVVLMFAGRVFNYMKTNGGLKSIIRALWHGGVTGENVPKAPVGTGGPKG